MTEPTCDARFGWAIPPHVARAANEPIHEAVLVNCAKPADHFGAHSGPWNHNYPNTEGHTTMTWAEDDRRNFRGEWVRCSEDAASPFGHPATCILPANHRGQEHFG